MRSLMLPTLVALLLGGCAAKGRVAHAPVEGPVGLGQLAAVDGLQVRPDRIIEDSRCPADVQCVHAGRLIIRATALGGGWSREMDLTLGTPVPVADGMLTLVEATPAHIDGSDATSQARFSFRFQGGR